MSHTPCTHQPCLTCSAHQYTPNLHCVVNMTDYNYILNTTQIDVHGKEVLVVTYKRWVDVVACRERIQGMKFTALGIGSE